MIQLRAFSEQCNSSNFAPQNMSAQQVLILRKERQTDKHGKIETDSDLMTIIKQNDLDQDLLMKMK